MKTNKSVDWKKVAGERLDKINYLKRMADTLRKEVRTNVEKEMTTYFHARCMLTQDEARKVASDMGHKLATRIVPHLDSWEWDYFNVEETD